MIGLAGGKLIHRVRLQSRGESSRTSDGGINESWTTDDTLWAFVRPVTGAERLAGGQLLATTTHIVEMRYNVNITPKRRLLHDIRADLSDFAAAGTPWKTITSASNPFTADMVGQYFTVTGGGPNWTQGDFRIETFTDAGTIVLGKAVASQNVSTGAAFVNRQLHIESVVNVNEDNVTTELQCAERVV